MKAKFAYLDFKEHPIGNIEKKTYEVADKYHMKNWTRCVATNTWPECIIDWVNFFPFWMIYLKGFNLSKQANQGYYIIPPCRSRVKCLHAQLLQCIVHCHSMSFLERGFFMEDHIPLSQVFMILLSFQYGSWLLGKIIKSLQKLLKFSIPVSCVS